MHGGRVQEVEGSDSPDESGVVLKTSGGRPDIFKIHFIVLIPCYLMCGNFHAFIWLTAFLHKCFLSSKKSLRSYRKTSSVL
jgi:hypothetical protein